MRKSIAFALFLLVAASASAKETATVKMVISSNTVVLATLGKPSFWISLAGVGTPETPGPGKDVVLLGKSDLGLLQRYLKPGTSVQFEERGISYMGYPLVLLYDSTGTFCWNEWLIKNGGAYVPTNESFPEHDQFLALETTAKTQRVGLWANLPSYETYTPSVVSVTPAWNPPTIQRTESRSNTTPSAWTPPVVRRYKDQSAERARTSSMLSGMINNYAANPPQPLNHVSASRAVGGNRTTYGNYIQPRGSDVWVDSYYQSDGTFVKGYWKSAANNTTLDNFSTIGNVNPYTGKPGYQRP